MSFTYRIMSNNPKISVVTVCFNAVKEIEKTMLSVLNQTYTNVEYIVIDGGSTDGTVDIIKKYADRLAYWVSEQDGGTYFGMNNGINVATGEWLEFINSGDYYYDDRALERLMSRHKDEKADVIYGYLVYKFSEGDYVRKHLPLKEFEKQMPIGHPATLVKLDLIKQTGFNTQYRIAADYNMFYHLYKKNVQFEAIQSIVAVFDSYSGVSSTSWKTLLEAAQINGSSRSLGFKFFYMQFKFKKVFKRIINVFAPNIVKTLRNKRLKNNKEYIPLKVFLETKGL